MTPHATSWRERVWPCLAVAAAYLLLVWGAILAESHEGSEAYDQDHHHVVVVDAIAASLMGDPGARAPTELLKDYPSATSPGYHAVLALARVSGVDSLIGLQLVSSLCGLVLALTLCTALGRTMPRWLALAWTAPLVLSPYFLGGSIWLTTDVAAWMLQLGSLVLILAPAPGAGRLAAMGALATLAVLVRQPAAWLVAPIAAIGISRWSPMFPPLRRAQWLAWSFAVVMPVVALGGLVAAWGGLVPPSFRAQHGAGANWATPAVFVALVGLWGSPWLVAALLGRNPLHWRLLAIGAGAGMLLGVCPQTDYSREAGRWGGPLWAVVEAMPAPMGRSVVIVALAAIGGGILAVLLARAWRRREGRLLALAMLSFVASATANTQCFERYLDLPILLFVPLLAAASDDEGTVRPSSRWSELAGPCVLALMQSGLSAVMVWRAVCAVAVAPDAVAP